MVNFVVWLLYIIKNIKWYNTYKIAGTKPAQSKCFINGKTIIISLLCIIFITFYDGEKDDNHDLW